MKRDRFRHIEAPRPVREPARPSGEGPLAGRPLGSTPPPASGRFAAVEAPVRPPPSPAPAPLSPVPSSPSHAQPPELTEPEMLSPDHPAAGTPDRSLFAMPPQREPAGLHVPHGRAPDTLFAPPGSAAATPTQARFNPAPPPIALDERDEDTLPFRRCADCGVDSNRFATHCLQCDADLTTPTQLAFQRQVAQGVRERQAREAEEAEQLRRESEERSQSLTAARRTFHEQLASQERRRIETELNRGESGWSDDRSLGDLLLSLLPLRFRRPIKWGLIGLAALVSLWNFVLRDQVTARATGSFLLLSFVPVAAAVLFLPLSWLGLLTGRHRRWWW